MTLSDIIDACNALGLPHGPPRGQPVGNISIACPVAISKHGDKNDLNFSCSVSYGNGISLARCFSSNCGYKGSFINLLRAAAALRKTNTSIQALVAKHRDRERQDITAHVAAIEDMYTPQPGQDKPKASTFDPQALPESSLDGFDKTLHPYAALRGIDQEMWNKWGMAFDQERQRIVFPVRRYNGTLVGITGRDVTGNSDRKYHNYAGLKRAEVFFGEQFLEEGKPFAIVEGQIDAIKVNAATGLPTIAPLGEGFSSYHVHRVVETNPPYIVLFPDNDAAGRLQASKIAYALEDKFFLLLALPPDGKDPADLAPDVVKRLVDEATQVLGTIEWPS